MESPKHNVKQKKPGHPNSAPIPYKSHTVWFHLYNVQKEAKLIYTIRSQANSYPGWEGDLWPEGGKRGLLECWSYPQSHLGINHMGVFRLWKWLSCILMICALNTYMCVKLKYRAEHISNAAVDVLVAVFLEASLFVFLLTKFLEVELLRQSLNTFMAFKTSCQLVGDGSYLSLSPCA